MAAIVTNSFKNQLIRSLITDLADSNNNYYIGYAKSDEWNTTDTPPTTTVNADREERNFRSNLQSIIKTTDLSFVVPRYNWVSGTTYRAYRDDQTATQNGQYYAFTESNRVYMCIRQGKDANGNSVASTVNPDTIGTGTSISGATQPLGDGYVWKYLYTVTASNLNKFATANFIPVEFVDSANDLAAIPQAQKDVQDAAISGSIVGYNVIDAGSGYTAAPTLTIVGNGVNARARASVTSGGVIGSVVVDDSAAFPFGSGYEYAEVTISGGGGTGATVRPIISKTGLGADPREDLRATTAMFNAKPTGDVNGDFLIGGQDFRQIGVIKDPKIPTSRSSADSDFTGANASALRILSLSGVSGIAADQTIVGQTDNGKAFVDKFESNKVFYHQNENTGFTNFSVAEVIQDSANASNTATITSDSEGEIDPFSGKLLYIENRDAVTRDAAQTEDVKIIIQL
tara:strand:- start:1051 stop:2421 length:1371 start_codon:yes stop_codon:yes gene_type:complete